MMTTVNNPNVELSRIVDLAAVSDEEPATTSIDATSDERQALCKRLDLADLSRLSGRIQLARLGERRIRTDVNFEAVVIQSCVVTLEPIAATIEESFTQEFIYGAASIDRAEDGEIEVWVEPEDEPENLIDDHLDLGELVTQHLALALDPYPRKPDAEFDGFQTETEANGGAFAALGELKLDAAGKRS